jgi:hypothetical protein
MPSICLPNMSTTWHEVTLLIYKEDNNNNYHEVLA